LKPILSERKLAHLLGIPLARLREVAANAPKHYRSWFVPNKRKDKVREITSPDDELKAIQRSVCSRVLGFDGIGPDVHGGVRDRSPVTNAQQHLGARWLVTIDVCSFYPSVRHEMVFRMFREHGCGTSVARLLTKLTTLDGALPQGAPTSVAVANLLLAQPVDKPTGEQARAMGVKFTRFIDDIGMSGDKPTLLINDVANRLSQRGLRVHRARRERSKLRIRPRSAPQEITGLLVNSGRPTLSRKHRSAVRGAIHELAGMADGAARDTALRSLRGRIAHVRRFHIGEAKRLERELAKALC
jgi:RNA-directed DNA polymerase